MPTTDWVFVASILVLGMLVAAMAAQAERTRHEAMRGSTWSGRP
jgi:hypothetical protein